MPFQVISVEAAKRLKEDNGDTYIIKYVNRMKAFKPPKHLVDAYLDVKRRSREVHSPELFKFVDSSYGGTYRYILMKNSISVMRELYQESKGKDIYLVNELDMPITDVILNIIRVMSGVWDK